MSTVDRFRTAVEQRDFDGLAPLFAAEPRFFSPVKFTPFEGRDLVLGVFDVLLRRVFEDFRYVGSLDGAVETADASATTDSHVLIFRAVVGGKQIHGMDLIQLDDDGLIDEFTVMVRPLSAVTALGEAVQAGLVAEGLVPAGG